MDIVFWFVACLSVLLTGLSKGGFAGLSVLSLPLFALVVPPIQGAAIMLPILMMQDCVSVWAYRKSFDRRALKVLLAGSLIGMALGTVLATRVSNAVIEVVVGVIAAGFVARAAFRKNRRGDVGAGSSSAVSGVFWGGCAGFTSFIANAGAPPFQVWVLPQRLPPLIYAGTGTMFFAVINAIKFVIFIGIGQVSFLNLKTSFLLLPVAVGSAFLGVWAVKRVNAGRFYSIITIITFIIGVYLTGHGMVDLLRDRLG